MEKKSTKRRKEAPSVPGPAKVEPKVENKVEPKVEPKMEPKVESLVETELTDDVPDASAAIMRGLWNDVRQASKKTLPR